MNLKVLYSAIIDPDIESAAARSRLPFPDQPALRNQSYYWLARETGHQGAGKQAPHPPHVTAAVRAVYPGAKGTIMSDSCQQAFHDEAGRDLDESTNVRTRKGGWCERRGHERGWQRCARC